MPRRLLRVAVVVVLVAASPAARGELIKVGDAGGLKPPSHGPQEAGPAAGRAPGADAREVEKYLLAIAVKIRRFILVPPDLQGNPEAELDIIVMPGGEVLSVRMRRASGQAAWDSAVERAIHRAQPLPLPSDPVLQKNFRELSLKFRPKE